MISLVLLPFDVDPNVVRPGWTPLLITILLALAMVGLFISMRRQFRRIDVSRGSGEVAGQDESVSPDDQATVDQPEGRVDADVAPLPESGRPTS